LSSDRPPVLVLVGGFLGAGKTTLILRAAELLQQRGLRAAVITNDQDSGLVDTRLSAARGIQNREVPGGCFCCRFSDLLDAADQLTAWHPDVIFAEPVGSCVDISATILRPLKAHHCHQFRLAPFTVLVDPELAGRVYTGQGDADVSFLFRQQIAEADLLCLTKQDRCVSSPPLPVPVDFRISAVTGVGVAEWLDEVLDARRVVGARLLDVDYTRYAEAEAALGWLNLHADIALRTALSPAVLAGPLLDDLDSALTAAGIAIAHLKLFDQAASGYVKAGICANGHEPRAEGDLSASPAAHHELVVNLRAIGDPHQLESIARAALARIEGTVTIRQARAFRPTPPRPEHRFTGCYPVDGDNMALTESTMLALGTPAPQFRLPDVTSGKTLGLSDLSGTKALLVMFICRHCPFVKHVQSELARLGKDYAGKSLSIVAISSNDAATHLEDGPDSLREMAAELGFNFPLLYDESQQAARAYDAACTPDLFLFDEARKLAYRGQLDDSRPGNGKPVTGHDLRTAIDTLLSGGTVDAKQKPSIGCNIKWKK
jgi:peroxiredoxin